MLIEHLKKTFADRARKNPAYSLRAFAKSLDMDSSSLSAILRGKRPISIKIAKKLVKGLGITDPLEVQKMILETVAAAESSGPVYTELAMDMAEAISSWEHFAILALLEVRSFKAQGRNISQRLNIPLGIVTDCMGRLQKLGLVRFRAGAWELTGVNMTTPSQVPSSALREGHRQFINKALETLEGGTVDQRDITGITMAINKAKLPEAKKLIQDFRRRLSGFLENGNKTAVYRLNIQLFPLSQE